LGKEVKMDIREIKLALEAFEHEHKVESERVERAFYEALRDVFTEKYKYHHPKPKSVNPEVDLDKSKILVKVEFPEDEIKVIKAPLRGIFKPKKREGEEVKYGDVLALISVDGKDVEVKFDLPGLVGVIEQVNKRAGENVEVDEEIITLRLVSREVVITPDRFSHQDVQKLKERFLYRIKGEILKARMPKLQAHINKIITGKIQKVDKKRGVFVGFPDLGLEGIIPPEGMIPDESYKAGQDIEVVVLGIEERASYPLILSRSDPRFIQSLLERSIPEISEGTIQIVGIAREAGVMTKVAVKSKDPMVNPVTALLGPKGTRLFAIKSKLPKNEIIDVIPYDPDPVRFAVLALQPAKGALAAYDTKEEVEGEIKEVINVYFDDEEEILKAKGRDGINVKLVSRLVGKKVNVLHISEFAPPKRGVTLYELREKVPPEIYEKMRETALVFFTKILPLAYMQRILGTDEATTIRLLEIIEDAIREKEGGNV
jgi:N utilization substance protein A